MPALQVRDFPEELYEELRNAAERDHRSIAQQTIYFVEAGLRGTPTTQRTSMPAQHEYETRAERIERRRHLFDQMDEIKITLPPDAPTPVETLAQARAERDRQQDELLDEILGTKRGHA